MVLALGRWGLACLLAVAFIFAAPAGALAEDGWKPLVAELFQSYPGLEAQRNLVKSLEPLPEAKTAWDDPMIEFGLMSAPVDGFRLDKEDMTQKTIGIRQDIPSLSIRNAEKAMAEVDISMARWKTRMLAAELVAQLKMGVYEIHYVDKALETLAGTGEILEEFILIANAKYAAGRGMQASVIQAQLEKSRLYERELALKEKRGLLAVRINRLLGRAPSPEFSMPGGLIETVPEPDPQGEWKLAESGSPEIGFMAAMLELAKKSLAKSEAEKGFNFSISAEYGQREDNPMERPDLLSLKGSMSVPLWSSQKQDRYIAGARAAVEEAESRKREAVERVKAAVESAALSMKKEIRTINLYKNGILPQAEQALNSARASYELDRVDFLTLLTTEQMLLEYRLMMEESYMKLRSLSAELEALTGAVIAQGELDHE
ncbi:MAG: TolC family protein [Nitrospinae bacterium]|nr:TolC family protein [Nitrospinota bacterium]